MFRSSVSWLSRLCASSRSAGKSGVLISEGITYFRDIHLFLSVSIFDVVRSVALSNLLNRYSSDLCKFGKLSSFPPRSDICSSRTAMTLSYDNMVELTKATSGRPMESGVGFFLNTMVSNVADDKNRQSGDCPKTQLYTKTKIGANGEIIN